MAETFTLQTWDIPTSADLTPVRVEAKPGEVITIVGANGSGKSALATWMASNTHTGALRRVLAQRKLWLENAGPGISHADRESMRQNFTTWDRDLHSRFVDRGDPYRLNIALFDLLGKHNFENQRVTDLIYEDGASLDQVKQQVGMRLFDTLNDVLEKSGLHTKFSVTKDQTFEATHRALGANYPISQMSDGERSALLLAADVVIAPDHAIMVIDEPERHLHRAISAGLIEALLTVRSDCAFVVLTHDLDLAARLSKRPGRTFTSAAVHWDANTAVSWDLHEIKPDDELPESARRAILGGRDDILFIEGEQGSIDLALYEHLYPGWSLVPSGSCEQVIRAVSGLRTSTEHHWVHACGVVDGDGRTESERTSLATRNIYALHVSEVENLYYVTDVLTAVATKQVETLGGDASSLVATTKNSVLSELGTRSTLEHLAAKLAKDAVARELLAHMPSQVSDDDVSIAFVSPLPRIRAELQQLHANNDYDGLISSVPIRDTAVRNKVAKDLGFQNFRHYQKAALKCIGESKQLAAALAHATGVPAREEQSPPELEPPS